MNGLKSQHLFYKFCNQGIIYTKRTQFSLKNAIRNQQRHLVNDWRSQRHLVNARDHSTIY